MKSVISAVISFFVSASLYAQFYTVGDDPARLRWYRVETDHFQIIYPEGGDSLARVYGTELERYRKPLSKSAGYAPGELIKVKMPVVLHSFNAVSNGSVAWAPKRMDLFTVPQAYMSEAMPWHTMLAIHESRHAAQMQFGLSHVFRPFRFVFGEMFAGAMAGIYPSGWILEGDAVVAETALSSSGRGRSAEFLNYYMRAFDKGDFRSYRRWHYGSYRYYTPDKYALGYAIISGLRYLYDTPHFTDIYLRHAARRPYDVLIHKHIANEVAGKDFTEAVAEAMNVHYDIWKAGKKLRMPFIPYSAVLSGKPARRYTEYSGNVMAGNDLYAVRSGISSAPALVRIGPDGKEKKVSAFGGYVSDLRYSPQENRIYWSEAVPDRRWGQKTNSLIRYMDLGSKRKKSLTSDGLMYNPVPEGEYIMVTEYIPSGGSRISLIDRTSGRTARHFDAPDSLQITETAVIAGKIYAAGISGAGYGIYRISPGGDFPQWETVLLPEPVQISELRSRGNSLLFTCDKNGSGELYRLDPHSGTLVRLTSTEYGASDFCFSAEGDTLVYSASFHEGRLPVKTAAADLSAKEEDFSRVYEYAVAERLSAQENAMEDGPESGAENHPVSAPERTGADTVRFSTPERYRKFPRLFNIHSWAPVYFDYDNITKMSGDYYYDFASLGAAAMIQNRLGTMTGQIGYSAHKDPYDRSFWRHSAHVRLTYSGLYPVFELSADFNDRASRSFGLYAERQEDGSYLLHAQSGPTPIPYIKWRAASYIPFNFSSGGWQRGLIPRLYWSSDNDRYFGRMRHNLGGSVRGYVIRSSAEGEIYPDWGVGLEAGVSANPGLSGFFSPVLYSHLYGYVPGFAPDQGLRLSATGQWHVREDALFISRAVNTLPRGLKNGARLSDHVASSAFSALFSADYAIPIYIGDFSIGSAFYGKRAVITPHFDCGVFRGGSLFSAGATAVIEFGCFFWIGTPVSIGATYSYNGGSAFGALAASGMETGRHFIGPVFSVTLPR